jgi:hypothetical protein
MSVTPEKSKRKRSDTDFTPSVTPSYFEDENFKLYVTKVNMTGVNAKSG